MRRVCDEIWIIDLGGDSRGTRKSANVFNIQTPVAIAIAYRHGIEPSEDPAKVHYARIEGTRKEKLSGLDSIMKFKQVDWEDCPDDWQSPFRPAGSGLYFNWPLLTDLMPWQHTGVEVKRTWPVGPDEATLRIRWRSLLSANDRRVALRECDACKINVASKVYLTDESEKIPIFQLMQTSPMTSICRFAYRDIVQRQFVTCADRRLTSGTRPPLWRVHIGQQIYLTLL